MSHLCVQKVIYSEWSSRRRDLEGMQFYQVGEMAWGGEAMGLLMYSALTIMECNFKNMHLFKQRQMESHTHSHTKAFTQYGDVHKGENTQCSRAMCVYVHVQKL